MACLIAASSASLHDLKATPEISTPHLGAIGVCRTTLSLFIFISRYGDLYQEGLAQGCTK